jgi:hypothetical protein
MLKKIIKIKKIYLWFAHKEKPTYFEFLDKYLDGIFTTTTHVFKKKYKNVKYIGHGISSHRFKPNFINKKICQKIKFIYVGRISKIKNIEYIFILLNEISKITKKEISFVIVGSPITNSDKKYCKNVKNFSSKLDGKLNYKFVGEKNFNQINEFFCENSIGINASPTGAIDKAPIEGIFAGAPFFYVNEAYNILYELCPNLKNRMQISGVLQSDISKIINFMSLSDSYIDEACKQLIIASNEMFGLENFSRKIFNEIEKL